MNSRWSKPALCSVALLVFVGPARASARTHRVFRRHPPAHQLFDRCVSADDAHNSGRFLSVRAGAGGQYLGHRVKRKAPLDFLAVTDHAEYLGVVRMALKPDGPLKGTRWGDWLAGDTVEGSAAAYKELLKASGESAKIDEFENPALQKARGTNTSPMLTSTMRRDGSRLSLPLNGRRHRVTRTCTAT